MSIPKETDLLSLTRPTIYILYLTFLCSRLANGAEVSTESLQDHAGSGKEIYEYYCYQCHGYSGNAETLASTFLSPPPRNFTDRSAQSLSREKMLASVAKGRTGTGMVAFENALSQHDIALVVDYIRENFMTNTPAQGRYHTPENGWPNQQRYAPAFPFATGKIALDTPWEKLSLEQQAGKRLFLSSCITCHDRARVENEGSIWSLQAISYPRSNGYIPIPNKADAVSGASPFMTHDIPPEIPGLEKHEQRGQQIFLDNCAFCHAADGTGRNWIGQFLEPPARDLTQPDIVAAMSEAQLKKLIAEGIPDSSMPAWEDVLNAAQLDELIAFLKRAFGSADSQGDEVRERSPGIQTSVRPQWSSNREK